jgi:hypothetical protein
VTLILKVKSPMVASLDPPAAHVLSKALSGLSDNLHELIIGKPGYPNASALGFDGQDISGLAAGNDERPGQFLFVRLPLVEKALGLRLGRLPRFYRHESRTKNETTCCVHQSDEVEVSVSFG